MSAAISEAGTFNLNIFRELVLLSIMTGFKLAERLTSTGFASALRLFRDVVVRCSVQFLFCTSIVPGVSIGARTLTITAWADCSIEFKICAFASLIAAFMHFFNTD